MKLFLIRHTSVAIEPGICYGQSDVPPASSFETEKAAIQQKLEGCSFDRVYCSPLQRCRKLAEFLFPDTEIVFDDRLKELDFGKWENQSWNQIYQSEEGKKWFNDYFHQACPGGESYDELLKRIRNFFAEINSSETGNICIVTHGGPLKIIKALAEKCSVEKIFNSFNPAYGEVTEIEMADVLS